MDPARRAFYRFHASLMEPWDGPAAVAFTDGTVDRRRPRPQRPAPGPLLGHRRRPGGAGQRGRRARHRPRAASCARAGCSRAGCSSSTPRQGRIVDDDEIKAALAAEHPYATWLDDGPDPASTTCRPGPCSRPSTPRSSANSACSATRTRSCGSSSRRWPAPAASRSARWASDTAIAVLSDRSRLLYDYFTQLFAQVTNPPLDAIREELVTSLSATIGPEAQPARGRRPGSCRQIVLPHAGHRQRRPGQAALRQRGRRDAGLPGLRHRRALRGRAAGRRAPRAGSAAGIERRARPRSRAAIAEGANIIVLSDRNSTAELGADPVAAAGRRPSTTTWCARRTRTQVGLVVESGDAREVAPHGPAHRLRCRRRQPLPGLRVHRRHDRSRACSRACRRARRGATTSRRPARASSR